jgi:hypothetical protein
VQAEVDAQAEELTAIAASDSIDSGERADGDRDHQDRQHAAPKTRMVKRPQPR